MADTLPDDVRRLRSEMIFLGTNLLAAAYRFNHEGIVPTPDLADAIQRCHSRFLEMRRAVAERLKQNGHSRAGDAAEAVSIDILDGIVKEALLPPPAKLRRRTVRLA